MKIIIIAIALLTIGCKKTEAPTPIPPTQKVVTVEPIEYMFAQSISYSNIQLTDLNGNVVGVENNYGNPCTSAYFTLEDGIEYRLTMNAKNNANVFNILLWEGLVTSSNGVLTYSKTGGTKNMFNDGSCGTDIYVVK